MRRETQSARDPPAAQEESARASHGNTPSSRTVVTFARLKEVVARQRGFLTGVVSLPIAALDMMPPRAFADFVICISQRRLHVARLEEKAPAHLLRAISPALYLADGTELAALQARRVTAV